MQNNRIHIGLAGDVMIGRGVDETITREGYLYPWGNMLPLLRSTDINIINLETTLTNSNRKVHKVFNFKATPDKVNTLTGANITAVNLANNHILDFSEEGLNETIRSLQSVHIKYTGAGMNEREAAKPVIITCGHTRIGLVGFTDNEPGWQAGASNSGVNFIDIDNRHDREKALTIIQQLRKETDIIISSIHWGPNMKEKPGRVFVDFAHEMIRHGTTIIHGHSAHIFQGIEIYRNKLILYDTGDFVDDYAVDPFMRNDHSFFFIAEVDNKEIYNLQLVPVLISRCQVNRCSEIDGRWNIHRMRQLSHSFGTLVTNTGEVIVQNEKVN